MAARNRSADHVIGTIAHDEVWPSSAAPAPRGQGPVVGLERSRDDAFGCVAVGVSRGAGYLRLAPEAFDQIGVAPADVPLECVAAQRLIG
jgi:hypothetical protein